MRADHQRLQNPSVSAEPHPPQVRLTSGSPQRTCYNWAQAEVVSGGLDGAQGYVNLVRSSATALWTPSNVPVANSYGWLPCHLKEW